MGRHRGGDKQCTGCPANGVRRRISDAECVCVAFYVKQTNHSLADRSSTDTLTKDKLSERVSKDMKKRGFKFVEPVICYSYLQ